MTTIDEARRRSTDQILGDVMTETGNQDAKRAEAKGTPLHFDAYGGLGVHRTGEKATDDAARSEIKKTAGAKVVGGLVDHGVDKAVGALSSFGTRAALGATWQTFGSVMMLHELYYAQVEQANQRGDKQRALGASDAGVVALANALPFDDGFKAAVSRAHAGSGNAAAAMKVRLQSPEHAAELEALRGRADAGLVDGAPVARTAAKELKTVMHELQTNLATARTLHAQGRHAEAESYERASNALVDRIDVVNRRFVAQFPRAHADAAYGLGLQCALHHAVRAEMGNEDAKALDDLVQTSRARLEASERAPVQVRG